MVQVNFQFLPYLLKAVLVGSLGVHMAGVIFGKTPWLRALCGVGAAALLWVLLV